MELVLVLIVVCMYLLPSIVAFRRQSATTGAAVVVNVFLGWTLLGWVIALALAVSGTSRATPSPSPMAKWGKF